MAPDMPPAGSGKTFVYVSSDTSATIRILELNLQTGALTPRGMATAGASPDYLAMHPSGKFLYALSEVAPGAVYAFSIDAQTGALTRLNNVGSGGNGPAHLSVHKSGKWVLTANYDSGHAGVIPIMPDGRLGNPVTPVVRAGGQAHMITDDGVDGKFVFVPLKMEDRTLMYRFDEATGALTPTRRRRSPNMGPARHMAFDRTGKFAYVLTESMVGGRRGLAVPLRRDDRSAERRRVAGGVRHGQRRPHPGAPHAGLPLRLAAGQRHRHRDLPHRDRRPAAGAAAADGRHRFALGFRHRPQRSIPGRRRTLGRLRADVTASTRRPGR